MSGHGEEIQTSSEEERSPLTVPEVHKAMMGEGGGVCHLVPPLQADRRCRAAAEVHPAPRQGYVCQSHSPKPQARVRSQAGGPSGFVSPWMAERPLNTLFLTKRLTCICSQGPGPISGHHLESFVPLVFLLKLSGRCFSLGSFLILAKN